MDLRVELDMIDENKQNSSWIRWHMGWGETRKLTKCISLEVGRGSGQNDKFYWRFLDLRSKPLFETMAQAKEAVEKVAAVELADALAKLSP